MKAVPQAEKSNKRMLILVTVMLVGWVLLWVMNAVWPAPAHLGVREGRLAPCADRPNCVNSQAEPGQHAIEPLRFSGPADRAKANLKELLRARSGVRLKQEQGDYLRYEFVTPLARFVDDVEFLFVPAENLIHVRSASRVGVSDLGVNRRRIESIRAEFAR